MDTTVREAYQHGYNQIFIEDAMTASTYFYAGIVIMQSLYNVRIIQNETVGISSYGMGSQTQFKVMLLISTALKFNQKERTDIF